MQFFFLLHVLGGFPWIWDIPNCTQVACRHDGICGDTSGQGFVGMQREKVKTAAANCPLWIAETQ